MSDWVAFLARNEQSADADVRKHERTGQPLGDDLFKDRVVPANRPCAYHEETEEKEWDGK